nr:hypothetical protein [Tanacetum cinerariifolium]
YKVYLFVLAVMSDASSTVTYTSVYTNFKPWRYYEEYSTEARLPRVIVYGYNGLPMQPVASPFPDYMPGPEHLSSPDYVPGPKHPPSPVEIPYVPDPEYIEYPKPSDDEAPLEDQPLPADASPIAASPDYVADFDLVKDTEDDQANYPADGGDGDDEPSHDNDDDDDTDFDLDEDIKDEPFEDEEEEEEEEHLALTDPSVVLITCLRRARKTVKPEPSMSASIEACIARHDALLSPPLPIPSPPLPLPSPLTTSLADTRAPLGYRAAEIRMRALLLSTSRRTDIPEADVLPWKKACLTTPALRFEVRESSTAGAARQPGPTYYALDREAMYAREAWAGSEDRSSAIAAHVSTLEAQKMEPKKRTMRATPATTTTPTTTVIDAQQQALIDRGVAAALAKRNADMSRNGDNINDSGTGGRRQMTTPRECTYIDFLKCQPMSFQGTEGVVGSSLTWWNSHMRVVGQDVAYAMPWAALKRIITEATKVERYIGVFPDMIHGSVKASNPQSTQEVIEFATKMMEKKMLTHAERQVEHKRKFDDFKKQPTSTTPI